MSIGGLSMALVALTTGVPRHDSGGEAFAVRTVYAPGDAAERYIACLERLEHRRWLALQRRGRLLEARVLAKTGERNNLAGPDWSVLSILRAKDAPTAERLAVSHCERLTGVALVRSEIMLATPASDHPAPITRPRRNELAFLIEFIEVQGRPEALTEYRETMRTSIGPAMGKLVEEDGHHSALFLETAQVRESAPGAGEWNQIHLRGYYPGPGPTHPRMTLYMEQADPARGGFADVFKRLDAIRTKPRDDVAREVLSLAVALR